nr:RNA-directed DNA polymerase, eukaryota [Tanacetum cinerariifolium]
EWSDDNLKGIINILQCFFLASGLKINIQNSQVLGVGVPSSIVMQAASSIGCGVLHKQFRYLGVMVGECMSRHNAWASTVDKLRSRLSKWKVKTLFIGGRLTLLKAVLGASPLYNMFIFKVPQGIMNSMEVIRTPQELNKEVTVADKVQGVVSSSFRRPVRAGSEYQHMTDLNLLMESVSLSHSCDRWICDLSGDGEFRVKEIRNFLDNLFLPSYADATRWVKYIPIKLNVFVWRVRRDFLPTRVNLSRREHLSSDMSMMGVRLASFGVFFGLELLVFFDSSLVQSQCFVERPRLHGLCGGKVIEVVGSGGVWWSGRRSEGSEVAGVAGKRVMVNSTSNVCDRGELVWAIYNFGPCG